MALVSLASQEASAFPVGSAQAQPSLLGSRGLQWWRAGGESPGPPDPQGSAFCLPDRECTTLWASCKGLAHSKDFVNAFCQAVAPVL